MLNPLYHATARAIVAIHTALATVLGSSGWAWALSIVVLTMGVRLVLFPLFVKQIRAQRTMQMLQPRMKELKEKYYKTDRQRYQEEVLKLQREHGNPLLGCLPIVVQIPLFVALFHTLNGFAPKHSTGAYIPRSYDGISAAVASQIAHAKIFGASLASAFTSPAQLLRYLGSNPTTTKIVAVTLILIMAATTYITQRQIFGRQTNVDPSQATQQKVLLYLSPLFLGIFGFKFPVGVLLYWFTTNIWSMGQQFFVLRRMPMGAPPPPRKKNALVGWVLGSTTPAPSAAAAPLPPAAPRPILAGRAGSVPLAADGPLPADRPESAGGAVLPRRSGPPGRPPKKRSRSRRGGRH